MTAPIVYVKNFGAKGDGVTDDTDAINRAISSMTNGGTLVFEPGKTYRKNAIVVVGKANVKLWGYGAKLYSFTSDAELAADKPGLGIPKQALRLAAPGTAIYGFDLYSNVKKRCTATERRQIAIESVGNMVADNRLPTGTGSLSAPTAMPGRTRRIRREISRSSTTT